MTVRIARIARYPVKGLGPEYLDRATLELGETLPADRAFALLRRHTEFDPNAPEWLPKSTFFTLMQSERLAAINCQYDSGSGMLTLTAPGHETVCGVPNDVPGKARIEAFLEKFVTTAASFAPQLIGAKAHSFSDTPAKYLSLLNLSSVAALEKQIGRFCDPRRFRANIWLDGLEPWKELSWVGGAVDVGSAAVHAVEPIIRCAATNVCPDRAEGDLNIPDVLHREFGHSYMGVYARVVGAGDIAVGDRVVPAADAPA